MPISERHSDAARENLAKAQGAHRARRVTKRCERCDREMSLSPAVAARKRFCSWECRHAGMRGSRGANSGKGQKMLGARNPQWKGGIGHERSSRYHEAEVGQWRRRVFHRDDYTCQRCRVRPTGHNLLRAHHIAPWAGFPTLRFDVDNGLTLCRDCHTWVHSAENSAREFLREA
jgi:hypothetical protein